jgi:hypothetical protein
MILGYNQERPKEENYRDFDRKLVEGLERLNIDGLSLMIYGSYIRGDYHPGRSDIDAVMTFSDDVVIDKEDLQSVGKVMCNALDGNNVPFQVSVTDIATMKDGRFNTYDESFRDYFEEEGRVVIGPDYREEFKYELPTMNEQIPVRFNLRKSRFGLLFAEHDRTEDYESFVNRFNKTLDSVSRGSKQILYFIDGTLRKNRFAASDLIRDFFPEIDTEPLVRIKGLYKSPDKLDRLYKDPEEAMILWNSSLTFFEEMIREYIRKLPN